ncbi:MAG: hypothetical protein RLZZ511_4116 [Cyanobacteriota bacterium]
MELKFDPAYAALPEAEKVRLKQQRQTEWETTRVAHAKRIIDRLQGDPRYNSVIQALQENHAPLNSTARPEHCRPGAPRPVDSLPSSTANDHLESVRPAASSDTPGSGVGALLPAIGRGQDQPTGCGPSDRVPGNLDPLPEPIARPVLPVSGSPVFREWRWWNDHWRFTRTAGIEIRDTLRRPNTELFPEHIDPNTSRCKPPPTTITHSQSLASAVETSTTPEPPPRLAYSISPPSTDFRIISITAAPGAPLYPCRHDRAIVGLDHVLCPDCNCSFAYGSPVYNQCHAAKKR